jgi:ethanolaminephosphotransferase
MSFGQAIRCFFFSGTSPLDKILNAAIWDPAATLVPAWVAPNLITLAGFFFILAGFLTVAYFYPDLTGTAPHGAFLFIAFCQFMYQTLDNVDGKQARKTKSSSPLGQLFDHGADALSTTLCILMNTCTIGWGSNLDTSLLIALTQFGFFASQWEEYHTGALDTVGMTEFQVFGMGHLLLLWWCGVEAYDTVFFGQPLRDMLMKIMLPLIMVKLVYTVGRVLLALPGDKKASALSHLFPVTFINAVGLALAKQQSEVYRNNALVVQLIFSLCFSLITIYIILCIKTKMPFSALGHPVLLLVPLVGFLVGTNAPCARDLLGAILSFVLTYTYQWIRQLIEEVLDNIY